MTIGVTGTKGKTTTSSLIAAVLAQGEAPVLLGGNIGTPLVERLPELTPGHRVVVELSELQLPTLSRGTDVSVYTHVTSDHLDRHGYLDAYRRVKRLLAELAPATGALVLNDEDPVTRDWAAASAARVVRYRRSAPTPGGIGVDDGWIVAQDVAPLTGMEPATMGPHGRVMPLDEIPLPGWHSVSNVAAAVAVGALFGLSGTGHPGRRQRVRRCRASPGAGRGAGRCPVRQRLAGHPAGRGHRRAAELPAATGAHLWWPVQGPGHGRAGDGGRGTGDGRRAHR